MAARIAVGRGAGIARASPCPSPCGSTVSRSTFAPSGGVNAKTSSSTGSYETRVKPNDSVGAVGALARRPRGAAARTSRRRSPPRPCRAPCRWRRASSSGRRRRGRRRTSGRSTSTVMNRAAASRKPLTRSGVISPCLVAAASASRPPATRPPPVRRRPTRTDAPCRRRTCRSTSVPASASATRTWSPPWPCDSRRSLPSCAHIRPEPLAMSGDSAGCATWSGMKGNSPKSSFVHEMSPLMAGRRLRVVAHASDQLGRGDVGQRRRVVGACDRDEDAAERGDRGDGESERQDASAAHEMTPCRADVLSFLCRRLGEAEPRSSRERLDVCGPPCDELVPRHPERLPGGGARELPA